MATKKAQELYREMLRIRMVEEEIANRYAEQKMRCPTHLCIGQEAIAVGVCSALKKSDKILSGHRSHGHYLAKGGNLKAMIAELYGKATGCAKGKGGSMHLVDLDAGFLGAAPIVGSTIPIALGVAFTSIQQGRQEIVTVFFGDAATETGVFHESLNFAAVHQLPVLFVCENNLYSVYSPLSVRQPSNRQIFQLAKAHGISSHQMDGNNVLSVYEISKEFVNSIRFGNGPGFLEFNTYRWREHCGPLYDNDLGYRTETEFQEWEKKCPVDTMQKYLFEHKLTDQETLKQTENSINQEIANAFDYGHSSSFPTTSELDKHIFAPLKHP